MNVMARPGMSLEEFLAWEADQERKWEFDGIGPVEMTCVVAVALATFYRGAVPGGIAWRPRRASAPGVPG